MKYKGWEINIKHECYGHGDSGDEIEYSKKGIIIKSDNCYFES